MFMFFKKEIECERCKRAISKKEMKIVDTRDDGRNKSGVKRYLCVNCLEHEIYHAMMDNKFKSILIHPMKGYNCYVYYNFKNLKKERASEHLAVDLEKILPNSDEHCSCGHIAHYSLCSPEIFGNDPWNWEVLNYNVEIQYLCKDCAYKYLISAMNEPGIEIKYFYPHIISEGFFTPWDV